MWVKPHNLICVGFLLFTGFSQIHGYFGEMDEYRDYLPCGSELPLEVDQKYYIRNERFGGNNFPRRRPLLFKRQAVGYYGGPGNVPQTSGNPRPLLPPASQGVNFPNSRPMSSPANQGFNFANPRPLISPATSFQNPAHTDFKRKSCVWKFHGNGHCQLMVHFDKYSQGDPLCTQQYVFVTDEDHEIQACENRILPPAFEAATKTITVKHYRTRRVGRLTEFDGYAICHSSNHGQGEPNPTEHESAFSGNVPVYYGNRGNGPYNYRPNPLQNVGMNNDTNPNSSPNSPSEGDTRRPSIRTDNFTLPTNTTVDETGLPMEIPGPRLFGNNHRYSAPVNRPYTG